MNKPVILESFYKLTASCHLIYDWILDSDFNILESNCPNPESFIKILSKEIRENMKETIVSTKKPCIYLLKSITGWIVVYDKKKKSPCIYLKGPFFNNFYDEKTFNSLLKNLNLNDDDIDTVNSYLTDSSVLTSSQMYDYVKILHYCVNGSYINQTDIEAINVDVKSDEKIELMTDQFDKTSKNYLFEQKLLNYVKNGDRAVSELLANMSISNSGSHKYKTINLDEYKKNLNVLLTLLSRTAVEGGMVQKTSFALCTEYRKRIEACKTNNELMLLSNDCILEYTERVRKSKKLLNFDPSIRLCCEYIDTHLQEKLSLDVLAKKAGYTKYHFSKKFHKDVGMPITEYIINSKINEAKFRLKNSDETVEGIAHDLCFTTRTYFTNVFEKRIGLTPTEYRKKYKKV